MRNALVVAVVLVLAGSVSAAGIVPDGATGLWRFQDSSNWKASTFGADLGGVEGGIELGPWTRIGFPAAPDYFSDGGILRTMNGDTYIQVFHGIGPNGGGSYVNEYTIAIDYCQTMGGAWNSLFQTAGTHNGNDGDLWIAREGDSGFTSTIGVGDLGYSTATFQSNTWHRIVWSVDNGSFFRVYVDGQMYLDTTGNTVDGRWSLNPDCFLFADDTVWDEKQWGYVGTAATWGRALTTAEVAQMGGWIDGAAEPTALLIVPEPGSVAMLLLGVVGLLAARSRRS